MEEFSNNIKAVIETNEAIVATKLRSLRVKAGIKRPQFAEALGVEEEELEAYENGTENVPASVIALVCALSGVPFEYFFGEEEADEDAVVAPKVGQEQPVLI